MGLFVLLMSYPYTRCECARLALRAQRMQDQARMEWHESILDF